MSPQRPRKVRRRWRTRIALPVAVTLVLLAAQRWGHHALEGKVVAVIDGDTIEVMQHGRAERIRLSGIDCPEKRQPFGSRAKERTSALAYGATVRVEPIGRDRYGRMLAEVFLPDGRSLNEELVRAGLAWWYRRYSQDARLAQLEAEARAARVGLWAETKPVPPWEFRYQERRRLSP